MGFTVTPLAQKARTQTLIADSDLNLGNYDLIATDVKGDTAEFSEFIGGVGNFESGLVSGGLDVSGILHAESNLQVDGGISLEGSINNVNITTNGDINTSGSLSINGLINANGGIITTPFDNLATHKLALPCRANDYVLQIGAPNTVAGSSGVPASGGHTTGSIPTFHGSDLYKYTTDVFTELGDVPLKLNLRYTNSYASGTITININGVTVHTIGFSSYNPGGIVYTYAGEINQNDTIDISWTHSATNNGSSVTCSAYGIAFGV